MSFIQKMSMRLIYTVKKGIQMYSYSLIFIEFYMTSHQVNSDAKLFRIQTIVNLNWAVLNLNFPFVKRQRIASENGNCYRPK